MIKSKSPEVKCQRALCGYKIIYKATELFIGGIHLHYLHIDTNLVGDTEVICNLDAFEKTVSSILKEEERQEEERVRQVGISKIKELMKGK